MVMTNNNNTVGCNSNSNRNLLLAGLGGRARANDTETLMVPGIPSSALRLQALEGGEDERQTQAQNPLLGVRRSTTGGGPITTMQQLQTILQDVLDMLDEEDDFEDGFCGEGDYDDSTDADDDDDSEGVSSPLVMPLPRRSVGTSIIRPVTVTQNHSSTQ